MPKCIRLWKRGILEAGVTAASAGYGQRWYEVTDYLTGPFTGSFAQTFITITGETWAEIPPDLQQILLEEGLKHEERNLEAVYEWDNEAVGQNIAEGMVYNEFSSEMQSVLKDAAINDVLPKWIDRAGGPESEAGELYNSLVAPIAGVVIQPGRDGIPAIIRASIHGETCFAWALPIGSAPQPSCTCVSKRSWARSAPYVSQRCGIIGLFALVRPDGCCD